MFLCGCSKKSVEFNENESLITAITPTVIERMTPLSINFSMDIVCDPEEALSIVPATKGSWTLKNDRTVVFTPEKPFKANSKVTLVADCSKLFGAMNASGSYKHVFLTKNASYKVSFDDLKRSGEEFSLSGAVSTDVPVSLDMLKKVISAKLGGKVFGRKMSVDWISKGNVELSSVWNFNIPGIKLVDKDQLLSIFYNGSSIGVSRAADKVYSGKKLYKLPSEKEFSVIDISTAKDNMISISFSKNLDSNQDINGFIKLEDKNGKKLSGFTSNIENNILTIYSDSAIKNASSISILSGIKSSDSLYLASAATAALSEYWDLPAVRFVNGGNILPTSQGTTLPIQTRNLSGLLIQVYQIPEKNMIQFLQVNDLDGSNEMYRVGEPIWTKNVSFDWDYSMQNRYITRGIDMSDLVKKYPNGLFQIRVTFRKKNIKYECHSSHRSFDDLEMPPDTISPYGADTERSFWDYWDEDLDYETRSSYWSYDDDPCHPAFYMPRFNSSCLINKNIVVSDLGLMAKTTEDKSLLYINVADIKTANPVNGAEVTAYTFTGAKITSTKTDGQGSAVLRNIEKAYFVTASLNGQTSYLKLTPEMQLSTSHFEIGGERSSNGVKGAIYGERGVWRPGDTMYLTFVLQDLQKKLPKDIPVSFELKDALNRVVETRTLTKGVDGFYPIEVKTEADAVTGPWLGTVKIGGQSWDKTLRVEAVVPNRLSIELESEKELLEPEDNKFELKSEWLHGAPAPDYKADVSVNFTRAATGFDGYADYTFSNPSNSVSSRKETIWEGNLDSDSKAKFEVDLNAGSDLPGKLRANMTCRVFEPSGAFSTQQKSFIYSPYKRYVGLKLPKGDAQRGMLLTDTDHTADVVLLNADGSKVSSASLSYTVYKLSWKWWWEKDALSDATYVGSSSYSEISSGSVFIKNGVGSFKFSVKYPDWGRYLVCVNDGSNHSAAKIVYIDWPGWAGRAQEEGSGSSSMVQLIADKKNYNVGESASITFASGKGERALITIEKSGQIVKQIWTETNEGTTTIKLPLTASMAPNIYVHLTLLQKHLQTANSLPIRLYGVVPILVSDPETILHPVVTAPSEYIPEKEATVVVSEENGKPMTYTLAVVDNGLLGLTNYHAPQLRNEFYKKEASTLSNWDIYNSVMNAYSGKLQTLLAIGGSEGAEDDRDRDSNRFAPVVKYFGPFELPANKKQAVKFTMPAYVGSVRLMVVAAKNGAYGVTEKSVPVKSDLMLLPALPRTLGTNEKIKVPVTLFNGTASDMKVNVKLNASGVEVSENAKSIVVPAATNKNVVFEIATKKECNAKFNFTANSSSCSASSNVDVLVESRGVPVTYKKQFIVNEGKSAEVSLDSNLVEAGSGKLKTELSVLPNINIDERLSYLIQYPHGCIEQITSGAFPQLYIDGFMELNAKKIDEIKYNIKSVIERYATYQTSSGGFGYWPSNSNPHDWGSCYAAHFLTEAKRHGYTVPSNLYDPLMDYLEKKASSWTSSYYDDYDDTQAYRLFVLALAGRADVGAMNARLNDSDLDSFSNAKGLLLAAAYAKIGRNKIAKEIMEKISFDEKASFRGMGGNFPSSVKNIAIYLFVQDMLKNEKQAAQAAKVLAEKLTAKAWYSTQETAWALLSLVPYYSEKSAGRSSYNISLNGNDCASGEILKGVSIEELEMLSGGNQNVKVENKGSNTIYGMLTLSGKSVAGTEIKTSNGGIELSVDYISDSEGRINPAELKLGDTFTIEITVKNNYRENVENLALSMPIPTCWELSNDRIGSDMDYRSSMPPLEVLISVPATDFPERVNIP
ncbi:MAG: alpha-2-macroglobulin [Treponema sp.]|nr:alpha-2-macroglobulin [Treponema sp.]